LRYSRTWLEIAGASFHVQFCRPDISTAELAVKVVSDKVCRLQYRDQCMQTIGTAEVGEENGTL
jgi:hypothetical protein